MKPKTNTTAARDSVPKIPQTTVSKDGCWRTFHKHTGLMQYVATGIYFARASINSKIFRRSLETDVFTDAKLKLPDMLKTFKAEREKELAGDKVIKVAFFKEARSLYEADLERDSDLADGSKRYRRTRIAALLKSWPGLDNTKLDDITKARCEEWKRDFSAKFDEQNFNNTLGTLRMILERGGLLAIFFCGEAKNKMNHEKNKNYCQRLRTIA